MELMLGLLALSAGIELISVLWSRGPTRKMLASLTILLASFASGGLLVPGPGLLAVVILILSAYRVVNLLRLIEARMNEPYLKRATQKTSFWLLSFQALTAGLWFTSHRLHISSSAWLTALATLQLLAGLTLFASTIRQLRKTRPQANVSTQADRDLPTVTVAVPARNEDAQLDDCLQAILASDYPKLEVIALDDCSQDRTPEVIRQLAHEGVQFVPGEEPRLHWLAKNQAYDRLARLANGDVVLFCGVDVRFAPSTIRQLVGSLLQKRKVMMSVIPLNDRTGPSLPQSMRYMWELALPRRQFNRPPVLSSCWLIRKEVLESSGGFAAVSQAITPEAYFARRCVAGDGYTFLRSDASLGLTSTKSINEQRETAIRTRYPQVHRRPEWVALLSLAALLLIIGPIALACLGPWIHSGFLSETISIVAAGLSLTTYGLICSSMFPRKHWFSALLWPIALLSDVALINYSMWRYEFAEVIWKGRNICLPVIRDRA